ncbi:MAG: hypothetical protein II956_14325 [Bacteroidales bacterium]|nr:hypothetical protein [Bacteroidales bacterium]
MSGTKKDRESLKNRFLKGMYPTEDDFADVFESYVHKDDTIEMSKVVLEEGGETVGEVIDKKADKQTLETFIKEVNTVLETVRDTETGEITKTVIQDLSKRIEDAEKDLASTANTAEKNESAIAKIFSILGKQDGETVSELAEKFKALSGDYATVYAFVSKVKAFLESADVADTTINRWQEIENFLQGITDTETLTGLLENLKTEIKNEMPKGNYLEQVADLDSYDNAPEGKIVQYTGQTNEQYERGHFYERKVGEVVVIPAGTKVLSNIKFKDAGTYGNRNLETPVYSEPFYPTTRKISVLVQEEDQIYTIFFSENGTPKIGDLVCFNNVVVWAKITNIDEDGTIHFDIAGTGNKYNVSKLTLMEKTIYTNSDGIEIISTQNQMNEVCPIIDINNKIGVHKISDFKATSENMTFGSPSSWQPIKVQYVID